MFVLGEEMRRRVKTEKEIKVNTFHALQGSAVYVGTECGR